MIDMGVLDIAFFRPAWVNRSVLHLASWCMGGERAGRAAYRKARRATNHTYSHVNFFSGYGGKRYTIVGRFKKVEGKRDEEENEIMQT